MNKTYLLAVLLISILCPIITRASHAQGADLSYQFVSYDATTDSSRYFVTATFYRDCSGIPTTAVRPLTITNTSCSGGTYTKVVNLPLVNGLACPFGGVSGATGCEVSHLCPNAIPLSTCNGNSVYPGMQKYVYSDTISLPGNHVTANHCSQWILSITESARNSSTNLTAIGDLYIEAVINNTTDPNTGLLYRNSSPVFQNDPVPFVCLTTSAPIMYNNATAESDGDSLIYNLMTPLQAHNSPLVYSAGYSVACPVKSITACAFDSTTGIFSYTPLQSEVDALAYLVREYRHGVLVGSTMRDVQVKILPCAESMSTIGNPVVVLGGALIDTETIIGCPGSDLIIDVPASNPNSNVMLQSSISHFPQVYSGMTFTQTGSGTNVSGRIEWQSIDTACRYVYINATSSDCPVASVVYKVIKICGKKTVAISPSSAAYCGRPVTLTASGGDHPIWTPGASLTSTNTLVTQASPTISTWYHLSTDCANDSVYIAVSPAITSSITHDTAICNGSTVQLSESVSSAGTYVYSWTPAEGLSDSTSPDPVLQGSSTHVYHCTVTNSAGCGIADSVKVSVNGGGLLALVADTLVAIGGRANLAATLTSFGTVSTTIPASQVTQQSTVQAGTDTLIQGGTAFAYPSPFGNYYKSARHQILYKASELRALFGISRVISSFALEIAILNSASYLSNVTIKMGSVQVDSLTHYEGLNSLQEVYSGGHNPVSGWNGFNLDHAYVWDGVSDLVVDICFANSTSNNINNKMRYSTTPFRSYWWTFSNGYSMCGVTGTQPVASPAAIYYQRPNARFGLAVINGSQTNFRWTPDAGGNTVNNPAAASTYAIVNSDQWYTATLSDSLCPQRDSVLVKVVTSGIHTSQNVTICRGDSVLLHASNATSYSWSDLSGVLSTAASFYYKPNQSRDVQLVMVSTNSTRVDTSRITVLDEVVWPGDADGNGIVDNNDLLFVGLAFGDTGAVRPAATQFWRRQCVAGWDSVFNTGVNCAHADGNGDGIIGDDDTLAINNNWGLVHAKTSAARQANYSINITTDKAFYLRYDTVTVTLSIGDNTTPIPNLYGIAYQFNFASAGGTQIVSVDQSGSWLNQKLDLVKIGQVTSALAAQSRINHKDTTGYGKIAEIKIVATNAADSAYLSVTNILALTSKGDTVSIGAADKAIAFGGVLLGVNAVHEGHTIGIYPNPNTGLFRVTQNTAERVGMTIMDAIGREVYSKVLTDKITNVDLSSLPEGIYIAGFSSTEGRSSKRVVITR